MPPNPSASLDTTTPWRAAPRLCWCGPRDKRQGPHTLRIPLSYLTLPYTAARRKTRHSTIRDTAYAIRWRWGPLQVRRAWRPNFGMSRSAFAGVFGRMDRKRQTDQQDNWRGGPMELRDFERRIEHGER